jgi:hypothetical protein
MVRRQTVDAPPSRDRFRRILQAGNDNYVRHKASETQQPTSCDVFRNKHCSMTPALCINSAKATMH